MQSTALPAGERCRQWIDSSSDSSENIQREKTFDGSSEEKGQLLGRFRRAHLAAVVLCRTSICFQEILKMFCVITSVQRVEDGESCPGSLRMM